MTAAPPTPDIEEPKDLGFGSVVGGVNEKRLLNRDGTFNPRRKGLPWLRSLSFYHYFLTMSWPRFGSSSGMVAGSSLVPPRGSSSTAPSYEG